MSLIKSRRQFLKRSLQGVAALGFAESLAQALFHKLISSAFASTFEPSPSGYYFHLSFAGAPPRWMFDLPLTPYGQSSSTFVKGGFGTRLDLVSGKTSVSHSAVRKTVAGKSLWLPPVWNFHTSKNFDSVLQHTLFIRGMDMEINNHFVSNARQSAPQMGGVCLHGAVADKSNRSIPIITDFGSAAARSFKSSKGLSPSIISTASLTTNLASILLDAFKPVPGNRKHNSGQNLQLQDQVFARLEEEMKKIGYTENALSESYEKAAQLVEANIQSLANNYPSMRSKYLNLIQAAFSPRNGSLDGLNTSRITPTTDPIFDLGSNRPASDIKLSDLRSMATSNINLPRMAQNFALMELLTDKLTSCFSMTFTSIADLPISGSQTANISHDQHTTGMAVSTFVTTLYYRSFLSCLAEFVDFLKAKNIFDKSVIHLASEFNRIPRNDGSGSDHGVSGSGTTLISGKFNKPEVIGNISKNDPLQRGTWGHAAPYSLAGENRPINVNDVARTITTMLGVQDVVSNGRPLLTPSGNYWVPRKREAKNV